MLECTQAEAAGALEISTRTLAKWLKLCPGAKLLRPGKRVNVDLDWLHDFMSDRDGDRWAGVDYVQKLHNVRAERSAPCAEGAEGVQNIGCEGAERAAQVQHGGSEDAAHTEAVHGFMVLRDSWQSQRDLARRMESECREAKKSRFRWQLVGLAALFTVVILGSGLFFGWKLFEGQGRELERANSALAATAGELSEARQEIQTEREQQRELVREVMDELRRDRQPVGEQGLIGI